MARPRTPRVDLLADLAQKTEILERELAQQRAALDRLKELGTRRTSDQSTTSARKTA